MFYVNNSLRRVTLTRFFGAIYTHITQKDKNCSLSAAGTVGLTTDNLRSALQSFDIWQRVIKKRRL